MGRDSNIHLDIYELTRRINKLLTSKNINGLQEVLKERASLINSLKEVPPPDIELRKKIVELENKNKSLLEKRIKEEEQAIKELQLTKKTLVKYKTSSRVGKLLDLKDI